MFTPSVRAVVFYGPKKMTKNVLQRVMRKIAQLVAIAFASSDRSAHVNIESVEVSSRPMRGRRPYDLLVRLELGRHPQREARASDAKKYIEGTLRYTESLRVHVDIQFVPRRMPQRTRMVRRPEL